MRKVPRLMHTKTFTKAQIARRGARPCPRLDNTRQRSRCSGRRKKQQGEARLFTAGAHLAER
jgi:hypothetical protein